MHGPLAKTNNLALERILALTMRALFVLPVVIEY
jgi:hypothetical protein